MSNSIHLFINLFINSFCSHLIVLLLRGELKTIVHTVPHLLTMHSCGFGKEDHQGSLFIHWPSF